MQDFKGRIAVVTGGGTGMGRELVRTLVREGAHVAMCDVMAANMAETTRLALADNPHGARLTSFTCDVSSEQQMLDFAAHVRREFATEVIHLLFNNAGIAGGGGFVAGDRTEWERVFGVCWYGVYYGCRAFLPMLVAADAGYVVNTSSVNGFWATAGQAQPHTAYCAAKFAVKGFTEALITDLRINAPHVKAAVVMPGHIGTSILLNSGQIARNRDVDALTAEETARIRARMAAAGAPVGNLSDDEIRALMRQRAEAFRDQAPTTAASAADIILDGVRAGRWRILVGEDAQVLDRVVREFPEEAYEASFTARLGGHLDFRGNAPPLNRS